MTNVLDLYCGAGGASKGYEGAGWTVRGVDIEPQPDYRYGFTQADVLGLTVEYIRRFDFVHASPPCQRDSAITKGTNKHLRDAYPDLYGPTKALLEEAGVPYVIENPAARPDVVLCGEMFGLRVIRHRRFELGGWETERPDEPEHRGLVLGMRHGKLITPDNGGYYYAVYGNGGYKGTVAEWQGAMGIHWTDNRKSIAEAIPPAYTRWIADRFTHREAR